MYTTEGQSLPEYTNGGTSMKTKQELIEKAKKEWGETWDEGMIEYDAEYNEYIVWVGKPDIYKAFFDADTLRCIGTKC